MGVQVGEFWVCDNSGFISGPYDDILEANNEAIDCTNPDNYDSRGNLCIVSILSIYD